MTGTLPLFSQAHEAIEALRRDLIDPEDGPRISTMRNYRFAIVQYSPEHEYAMRTEVQRLVSELEAKGWFVLTIDLEKLLLDRIRCQPGDWSEKVIAMEQRMAERQLDRGLNYLKSKLLPLVEGSDGLAGDCKKLIQGFVQKHPDKADQTLVLIGRAGGLYPFFRTSVRPAMCLWCCSIRALNKDPRPCRSWACSTPTATTAPAFTPDKSKP
jgi:hypothetical protein